MIRGDDVRRDGHGYLDASVVANLNLSHKITPGYDDTSAFVATDQGKLCRDRPVTVDGMKISVADAGVLDVDQDFIRPGLWDCSRGSAAMQPK